MKNYRPEDVLEASYLEVYERQREVLWLQLVDLNCNIFILRRILNFPFDLFLYKSDSRHFWHLTTNALIERSILISWRIVVDKHADTLTIRKFKNNVLKHLKNDELKGDLRTELKQVDFENQIRELEEKITYARKNYIAHQNDDLSTNPNFADRQALALSLEDLQTILKNTETLFDVLCFKQKYSLWPLEYMDDERSGNRTDIDQLLDLVAKNSNLLNMPEKRPHVWVRRKPKLADNDLKILNEYRSKFGLSEV